MAVLRHIIEMMLNPFFLSLLGLGLSSLFLWRETHQAFARCMLSLIFCFLVLMSTGWLPRYMTYKLESQYPVVKLGNPNIQWVVVLGGGQNPFNEMPVNNALTSASIKRLIEGIRLFRDLPQAKLVLSGGGAGNEQPEAWLMRQLSQWFEIPQQRVILENKSINTADQARELISIVGHQSFYLVTSAIHMPRSMALFEQQGLHPIAAPTDFTFFWNAGNMEKIIIPNTYNLSYFSIAMHEILGRLWTRIGHFTNI